jgi:hypothetical protein
VTVPGPFPGLRRNAAGAAAGRPWRTGVGGLARAARTVAARLEALEASQLTLRTATLTAATSTTATILLAETSLTGVHMLASYTPTMGDTVLLLQAPGVLIILGKAA